MNTPSSTATPPRTTPIPVIDASENVSDVPTPTAEHGPVRTESDSLGSRDIPADAYWGVHTARALENFPIAKRPISVYPDLIVALASVKQAAARANLEIGVLDAAARPTSSTAPASSSSTAATTTSSSSA